MMCLGFIDVVIRVLVEVVVFLKIRSSSREIHRYSLGRETARGTPKTPSLRVHVHSSIGIPTAAGLLNEPRE